MKTQISKQHATTLGVQQPTQLNTTFNPGVLSRAFFMLTLIIAAMVVPAAARSCMTPPPNMVAWYPFDYNTWDISPWQNSAYPVGGMQFNMGKVSYAAFFNGTNSYAEAPDAPQINMGTGDFSVDAWVYIANSNDETGSRIIVDKRSGTGASLLGYSFFLYNGRLGLTLAEGPGHPGQTVYLSSTTVQPGFWNLVAVTVSRNSPTGGIWYLNGSPIDFPFNPTGHQGSLNSPGAPLEIGAIERQLAAGGDRRWFKGGLDEVEIFNRALYPVEILYLYHAGSFGKCK